MRVVDITGEMSYFETETNYCNNMILVAEKLEKENKRGLFLMDEPMHSTPPIEGVSVAYSVAKYLGNMKGVSLIITTHFHNLIELEYEDNNKFINLSVSADFNKNTNNYDFNYKINRGGSKQIIAIELLENINLIKMSLKVR